MDKITQSYFENLEAEDKEVQFEAFGNMVTATNEEVDWAYEVWDQLKAWLTDSDNHRRSRGAQFLSRLAISDPEKRILNDFPAVWAVTKDKKFVTARHTHKRFGELVLRAQSKKKWS